MDIVKKSTDFLSEVRLEIKKVNWPTRQETIRYTLIVIGVSFVIAVFLGTCDSLFAYLLKLLINSR